MSEKYGSERKLTKRYGYIVLYKYNTTDFFWTKKEALEQFEGGECCCGMLRVKINPVSKVKQMENK